MAFTKISPKNCPVIKQFKKKYLIFFKEIIGLTTPPHSLEMLELAGESLAQKNTPTKLYLLAFLGIGTV